MSSGEASTAARRLTTSESAITPAYRHRHGEALARAESGGACFGQAATGRPAAIRYAHGRPEPGTGAFHEIGKGKTARAKITYRIRASAFHDNTRMTAADAVYLVLPEKEADTPQADALQQAIVDHGARLAGCILAGR